MLSKEHGATVLGVCMLYDVIVLNRDNIYRYVKYFSGCIGPRPIPNLARGKRFHCLLRQTYLDLANNESHLQCTYT